MKTIRKILNYLFGEEVVKGVSDKFIKESLIIGVLLAVVYAACFELLSRWYG